MLLKYIQLKILKFDNDVIIVKSIDELGLVFEKKVIIQLYDKINNKLIKSFCSTTKLLKCFDGILL